MEMTILINGKMLIGNREVRGSGAAIYARNPATGETLEPAFLAGTEDHVNMACELAKNAFNAYRLVSFDQRAFFIDTIAKEILALGDALIERAVTETGLPQMRIEGELARTVGQLQLFADVVRTGNWVDARIDPAIPERSPIPRPDLRSRHIPIGPVAVFGASNFPLAFSVAGGDTASALAAGCPVIVKAHSAHLGTSELVGHAINRAANKTGMPEGVFSLIFGFGKEIGSMLVSHPTIKAVGFTGSQLGGKSLMKIAADRPAPIPVYAEMSSINPIFLLPGSLKQDVDNLAAAFTNSLTMGAGQFCTNPGLVIGLAGNDLDSFKEAARANLAKVESQTMLTEGIHLAFTQGIAHLSENEAISEIASGQLSTKPNQCQAKLYTTSASQFLADRRMRDEVFGASSLIVECRSIDEMMEIASHLEGELTATLQMHDDDIDLASDLIRELETKAGRILCNGFPTGVEVCHAMVHGGPYPATSDSRTTSVGSAAIQRFLRPVCYQNLPHLLLPSELQDENSLGLMRLVDGIYKA